jgi:hypothetical protein
MSDAASLAMMLASASTVLVALSWLSHVVRSLSPV